ncbi:MAG: hypothetical protein ACOCUS_00460, partial [Polyangiales bacterium]
MAMRLAIGLGGTDWGRSGIGGYLRALLPRLGRELADRGSELHLIGTRTELETYADGLGEHTRT